MAAKHGERRLQLVAGVVEELALPHERRLQAVQHPVDGAGQRGDVVVAGLGDPLGQVGLPDLLRRLRRVRSGASRRPDCQAASAVISSRVSDGHDQVGAHRVPKAGPFLVEVGDDHQRAGLVALGDRLGRDQQLALVLGGERRGAAVGHDALDCLRELGPLSSVFSSPTRGPRLRCCTGPGRRPS